MWRNIVGQGLYQATVLVIMLFWPSWFGFDYDTSATGDDSFYDSVTGDALTKTYHYTFVFNTFVFM